ncbi:hypothetical protein Tco_0337127 [Tanacetum coccineum]
MAPGVTLKEVKVYEFEPIYRMVKRLTSIAQTEFIRESKNDIQIEIGGVRTFRGGRNVVENESHFLEVVRGGVGSIGLELSGEKEWCREFIGAHFDIHSMDDKFTRRLVEGKERHKAPSSFHLRRSLPKRWEQASIGSSSVIGNMGERVAGNYGHRRYITKPNFELQNLEIDGGGGKQCGRRGGGIGSIFRVGEGKVEFLWRIEVAPFPTFQCCKGCLEVMDSLLMVEDHPSTCELGDGEDGGVENKSSMEQVVKESYGESGEGSRCVSDGGENVDRGRKVLGLSKEKS